VNRVHSPVENGFQSGDGGLQHSLGDLGVGLGLLVSEELNVIIGQCVEEIDLFGNVRQLFAPGLQQRGDPGGVDSGVLHRLTDVRLCNLCKGGRLHGPEIGGVEIGQLLDVENSGGLGDTGDVEHLHQLVQREDLLLGEFALGRPAQQRHIVQNGVRQEALSLQILVGGIAVALGHLVVLVPHDGRAVDVGGDLPAEGLVQQIVLGCGGQVLAAPDHVGDAHEVIVHHVGEVVGGQAVPLQQHLIVQSLVLHGDVTEGHIMEGGGALVGDPLTDHVGLTGSQIGGHFFLAQIPAGIVRPVKLAGVLLGFRLLAEAVVGCALFHQELGVGQIQVPALGLDIGAGGAAHVRAFIVIQMALLHGAVDHVRSTLHQTALIRILDPENEGAVGVAGDEPGVQRGAQVAHVHIAGGGGGEPGTDLPLGDAGFQIFKKCLIQSHE